MFDHDKKAKLIGFFRKNGFYLVLAVCVLGVGLGAFFGIGRAEEPAEEPQQTALPEKEVAEQVQAIVTPKPTLPQKTPVPAELPAEEPEPAEAKKVSSSSPAKVTLTMPLDGEIIKAFSGETLVYNPTLNMWMTHNGIDIASKKDTAVAAALAGEVADVRNDDSQGLTVEISHGVNGRTVYAGLAEASVKAGDKINAGQPLGTAGMPPFESAQGTHLHFEYIVKDQYVDPVEYLK